MSIIEDALKRAGAEEVKVEDLRPGDTIILWEPYECGIYEGTFVVSTESADKVTVKDASGCQQCLYLGAEQRWYLVERAPVEQPTGWGAIVEVDGVKYSRIPEDPQDDEPWVREAGSWRTWEELIEEGAPKILFEGISE